ncbi:MAG: hypothetical protein K6F77_07025 [Lachnospiraceae bacterium]|nr:hypothetical protein [Lachnospiraceae bacterium]
MKKRILDYYNRIEKLLSENPEDTDWEKVLEEHLVQVSYFQHERLIHLIVTVLFALATFITLLGLTITGDIWYIALLFGLLVLLVPYISHYYLLENTTQKMYDQYDEILKRRNKKNN